MDLLIDRPMLNAKSTEENIATVDTWIADTSDKLNVVINKLYDSASASADTATTVSGSNTKNLVGLVPYLGDYKKETTQVIYND